MDAAIGFAAGDVYRHLEIHGPSPVSQIKKGTGLKDALLHQALGWLAREDKIARETSGKQELWRLSGS